MTAASYVEISVGEHPGISGTCGGWLNIPNARSRRFSDIPSRIIFIVVVVVRLFSTVDEAFFLFGFELLVQFATTTSNDALVLTNLNSFFSAEITSPKVPLSATIETCG